MTSAYSYIRFSTPEQAQGDSLRRQTAKAELWAQSRGLTLDNSLRDLGVSAYHGANRTTGALKTFLQMVEDGKVARGSYLIIESLDRLSREAVMDAATRLFDLIRAGIVVVTLSDGQEYSEERLRNDWTPLMFSLIVMARAHEESKIKSERVGEAWRQKKEIARKERHPLTKRCPGWLELKSGEFVKRQEQVEIVCRIFRETIEGFGRREIAGRLNAEKRPTFRTSEGRGKSNGWQTSTIAKVIQSRAVLGEYQPHSGTHRARNRRPDGDPIKDYYPKIIDEQTYWLAQKSVSDRRQQTAGRRGTAGAHLLRGLAKCSVCNGPMHIINKGKPPKGTVYLRCDANRRKLNCANSRSWRVDEIEDGLLLCLTSVKTTSFEGVIKSSATGDTAEEKIQALKAELEDLHRKNGVLLVLAETGDEQAISRFQQVAEQIKEKKKILKKEEKYLLLQSNFTDDNARLAEILSISESLPRMNLEEKRNAKIKLSSLVRTVVDRVNCDPCKGAYLTLMADKKAWRVHNPLHGTFAYQIDLSKGSGAIQLHFLLMRDPSTDALNAFFRGKAGHLMGKNGHQAIFPEN